MRFRLVPKSMTLNCYKVKFSRNFAVVRIFGRAMSLVSVRYRLRPAILHGDMLPLVGL